jgi:hypothetical protein
MSDVSKVLGKKMRKTGYLVLIKMENWQLQEMHGKDVLKIE